MADIVVAQHIAEFEPSIPENTLKQLAQTIEDVLNVFDEDGIEMASDFKLSFIKGMAAGVARGRVKVNRPEAAIPSEEIV